MSKVGESLLKGAQEALEYTKNLKNGGNMSLREKELALIQKEHEEMKENINLLNAEYVKHSHELYNHNNASRREVGFDYFESQILGLRQKLTGVINYIRDRDYDFDDLEADLDEYIRSAQEEEEDYYE